VNGDGPLLLDGDPASPLDAPLAAGAPLLGRDPFEASAASEPWLDALDRLATRIAAPRPALRAPPESAPLVSEIPDGALPKQGVGRWLGDAERRRIAALRAAHAGREDPFGLDIASVERALPIVLALYRYWFRVQSEGHEHLPRRGGAILVANHGGLLPFDGAMAVLDLLLHSDPPRLARAIVDRWAGSLPWVNVFFARVGQVTGTHENFERLLDDGEAVLVFPEGMDGIRKPITQRHRLQRFHVGFVEHALRARAPIVPVAILGSDDQAPILFDLKPVARWLGLPTLPITPTFPWLGPLGLVPYPVRYRIVYGEPMRFHERFAAHAADDPAVVRALAGQVRRAVQGLIDKSR
jgi:1-acyl-sn-glycerol-3-phosphate acyltransferase